jgi:hypothetical protein
MSTDKLVVLPERPTTISSQRSLVHRYQNANCASSTYSLAKGLSKAKDLL